MATVPQRTPVLKQGQRLSQEEFLRRWEARPDIKFAELIEGVVYMPSPLRRKQGFNDGDLGGWLFNYSHATPGCRVGHQATWFMHGSIPQPDIFLMILPEYGGQAVYQGNYLGGAPELAVEICASSTTYDLGVKKRLYEEAEVQEYLAVLVEEEEVRWHHLQSGQYQLLTPDAQGILRSQAFPGLWLNTTALFTEDVDLLVKTLRRGLRTVAHKDFVAQLAQRKRSDKS